MSFWHEAVPFLISRYPWVIPIVALLFPLAAVGKGVASALTAWQQGRQQDYTQSAERYTALLEHCQYLEKALAEERAEHAKTAAKLLPVTLDKRLPPPI